MAGKKTKIRISILLVLAAMLIIGISVAMRNPRVKLLYSVINFSETTLKNEAYLLYGVDIMEVFSDYANSDTRITGVMGFPEIKGMNATISVDMDAERSFAQKKFASESSLNILWAEAGQLNLYAQDKTWYISAPILGADIGYAFPTDVDWFPKMPELTSDIDRAWFRENYSNIVKLMSQIEIEKTDKTIENDDGTESTGYSVTIHKGDGHFIWELLGMDDPDYDVNVRGRHGVDLGPDLDGEHLTKAYDTKLAVRKAWEENDLVIAAGDSSNDTEMINPITYLLDEGCFAKSLTPENKTYLKKHINEPAKIIEYLDTNSKVAEDFLSLPYCGIILKNEDSDLFAKFKPFTEGKYQKLVVAKQGELEKGIKDAIALYSKQTPKYKEVLDSELKKQIADNEPPHKPDDEGGNNFWKYILGGGCVIGLIAAVHKMVKNKKAPVIAGE